MSAENILIVGLGNPGKQYVDTRHNIGFKVIDEIAKVYSCDFTKSKFSAQITSFSQKNKKIFLLKPETYMNNSGVSVRAALDFYKLIPKNVIVVHDDIDLDLGRIKIKIGGGSAGHNGIRSIDSHIGKEYLRVRVGVGRPDHKMDVSNFVLGNFVKDEMTKISALNLLIANNLDYLLADDLAKFTSLVSNT